MNKRWWWFGAVIVVLFSAGWLVVAPRISAAIVLACFVVAIIVPVSRRHPKVLGVLWLAFFLLTWSPIDITLVSAPDGPKLVGCCPDTFSYAGYLAAFELQRQGKCRYCSDLVTGFEAKKWIVW